ncbi:hypothetical protein QJS66_02590 [Kocuria rhizophila]|nr:hypothetical protein QJS66_02590 [Kocuria rhizophila]
MRTGEPTHPDEEARRPERGGCSCARPPWSRVPDLSEHACAGCEASGRLRLPPELDAARGDPRPRRGRRDRGGPPGIKRLF